MFGAYQQTDLQARILYFLYYCMSNKISNSMTRTDYHVWNPCYRLAILAAFIPLEERGGGVHSTSTIPKKQNH